MMQKAAITGIGMMTAIGLSTSECWENALKAVSGIGEITKFNAVNCQTRIGGQLPPSYSLMEKEKFSRRFIKQSVTATRLMRMCAGQALEDSGLVLNNIQKTRCVVIMGTSGSSVRSPEEVADQSTSKFKIIREMVNALPAWVTLDTGFGGPSFTISAGACSGSAALVSAWEFITREVADIVIVGAVDTLLTLNFTLRANALGLLSRRNHEPRRAVRPFDISRDGFVLADGGAVLVLESPVHAASRNARTYAYLEGCGIINDHSAVENPITHTLTIKNTMEYAISSAKIPKEKIGYINAEGNATGMSDRCEVDAIQALFGEHIKRLCINSSKPMLGHTIGASGVIDAALTALSLYYQKVFPTLNSSEPEPGCELDFILGASRNLPELSAAMSNNFDPAGHFYSLVFSNPEAALTI
jgi:3-oxoacyl-[acyl-carrier-protein] synthase II